MLDSIGDQSEILFAYVNDIKSACHELLNILLGQVRENFPCLDTFGSTDSLNPQLGRNRKKISSSDVLRGTS